MAKLVWRKSSYSGGGGNECVELAFPPNQAALRDSKAPNGPRLTVSRTALTRFLDSLALPLGRRGDEG